MPDAAYQRYVLLNRMVSISKARAPAEHHPPLVPAAELLGILEKRRAKRWTIEHLGVPHLDKDDDKSEEARIAAGKGHDFIWLRQIHVEERKPWRFATLLFGFVDASKRSFSVVDIERLTGREISGEREERGSVSAHIVVRLPIEQYDDLSYRCAIEVVPSITRLQIENFLCRQLRRQAIMEGQSFTVRIPGKGGKPQDKEYRYHPRLELFADIGRKIDLALSGGRELAHMTFTKRSERRSIGKPTAVDHKDIVADVEFRISARQGPDDPQERFRWLSDVRAIFEGEGYESRMYYRQLGGTIMSGQVHHALAGATDLVMCQKELISLSKPPKDWHSKIDSETTEQMIALLSADEHWERRK